MQTKVNPSKKLWSSDFHHENSLLWLVPRKKEMPQGLTQKLNEGVNKKCVIWWKPSLLNCLTTTSFLKILRFTPASSWYHICRSWFSYFQVPMMATAHRLGIWFTYLSEIGLPSLPSAGLRGACNLWKSQKNSNSFDYLLLDFYHLILTTKRALNCFLNIYLENLRVKFLDNQVIKPGNLLNVLCLTSWT